MPANYGADLVEANSWENSAAHIIVSGKFVLS